MKCDEMEVLMAEILAGERERDPEVDAHLVECAACRRDFETARAGWQAAAELPAPKPAPSLVHLVRRQATLPSRLVTFFQFGTAAAAALLVALLVVNSVPTRKPSVVSKSEAPTEKSEPIAADIAPEGAVGSLVVKDLHGRPVGELSIGRHAVQVEILDGIAKTTIEEVFVNHTDRRLEGTFYCPLPGDASISRLAMEIDGKLMEGSVVERERAREVYEGIVRRMQDPALLEWMPGGIFKCRIFPIEPRSEKRIILAYTQALPVYSGRVKYVYPLASEKARGHGLAHVTIDAAVKFAAKVKSIECPSHRIDLVKKDEHEAKGHYEARNLRPTNDFVLDVRLENPEEFVFLPHKVEGEDGYFLACYTPSAEVRKARKGRVALVLDISASVSKPELDAEREMAEALLDRADAWALYAHNVDVQRFEGSKRDALLWLGKLETGGACDVKKALDTVAAERPDEIVYIGEGVPTMGEEKFDVAFEGTIRTVAVGSDAATALLEELARKHGGVSFAISPSDRVRDRVREIADLMEVEVVKNVRVEATQEVYDLAPAGARNALAGERLVITGRCRGNEATLAVGGREFKVAFPAKEEKNSYVKRIWAQRKIADLTAQGDAKKSDVVACSTANGIMTPLTSFLVLENEQAYKQHDLQRVKQVDDTVLGLDFKSVEKANEAEKKVPDGRWANLPLLGGDFAGQTLTDATFNLDEGGYLRLGLLRSGPGEWQGAIPDYAATIKMVPNAAWEVVVRALISKSPRARDEAVFALRELEKSPEPLEKVKQRIEKGRSAVAARVVAIGDEPGLVTLDAGSRKGLQKGMLFAIMRDTRFIAVVAIQSVAEESSMGSVWQGISVGPIQPGDQATAIDDPASFYQSLPVAVRLDLSSNRNVERVRNCVEIERNRSK